MSEERVSSLSENSDDNEIVKELILSGRHSQMVVLVFLYKVGKATLSDIQRALTGGKYRAQYNWTLSVISELKNLDLIYEDQIFIKEKIRVRLFDLTEKGRRIARKLSEILQL
ncbi:MAG: hypothetical protein QXF69_02475 [Thermofilaceae archaeon]